MYAKCLSCGNKLDLGEHVFPDTVHNLLCPTCGNVDMTFSEELQLICSRCEMPINIPAGSLFHSPHKCANSSNTFYKIRRGDMIAPIKIAETSPHPTSEEVKEKSKAILEWERDLDLREKGLNEKENALKAWEETLQKREKELQGKLNALEIEEKATKAKQRKKILA